MMAVLEFLAQHHNKSYQNIVLPSKAGDLNHRETLLKINNDWATLVTLL